MLESVSCVLPFTSKTIWNWCPEPVLLQIPTMGSKDNFVAEDPDGVTNGERAFVAAGAGGVVPAPMHPARRTRAIQRTIRTSDLSPCRLWGWQTDRIFIPGSTLPDNAILYRPGFEYFPVM
jgi:hypothetical protein